MYKLHKGIEVKIETNPVLEAIEALPGKVLSEIRGTNEVIEFYSREIRKT